MNDSLNSIRITNVVAKAATDITDYLLPKVICFDKEERFYKKLCKEMSWTEKIESVDDLESEPNGEIVIIYGNDNTIVDWMKAIDRKGRAIIFCQTNDTGNRSAPSINSFGIRLIEPSVDDVLFHVKCLLILQESMFYYDTDYPICSLNNSYRAKVKNLVSAISQKESTIVCIEDLNASPVWYHFLFDSIPNRLRPFFINESYNDDEIGLVNFISTNNENTLDNINELNFYIVFTSLKPDKIKTNYGYQNVIEMDPLENRVDDMLVQFYLASIYGSFNMSNVPYYTGDIENTSFKELKSLINDHKKVSFSIPIALKTFMDGHNRLSLATILLELENMIFSQLKVRAQH